MIYSTCDENDNICNPSNTTHTFCEAYIFSSRCVDQRRKHKGSPNTGCSLDGDFNWETFRRNKRGSWQLQTETDYETMSHFEADGKAETFGTGGWSVSTMMMQAASDGPTIV